MPSPESPTRVLLVEGSDEYHVIEQLRNRLARQSLEPLPEFSTRSQGGVERLLDAIEYGYVNAPGLSALGIIVDANDDRQARWRAVTDRLREAGVEPPGDPEPSGVIIEGAPRIGVWMMPDNKSPGELEDFIAKMIPPGDAIWPLSRSYVAGIPAAARRFAPGKTLRAQVHAWLAVREDPRRMGLAITAGDLDTGAEPCQSFVRWLRALFSG